MISHEALRGEELWEGLGWGKGGSAEPYPFLPKWRSGLFPLERRKAAAAGLLLPAPTKPSGKGLAFLFFLFTVSNGLHITNYSPLLSPNNQLVPKSESPAPFRLSCKMQGRFSPEKTVWLLISGAKLREQPDTFVER